MSVVRSPVASSVERLPHDDRRWTTGCVSLELLNQKAVLAACTPKTQIDIPGGLMAMPPAMAQVRCAFAAVVVLAPCAAAATPAEQAPQG